MKMKTKKTYFLDWHITKKIPICSSESDKVKIQSFKTFVKNTKNSNIYIETGMPYAMIYELIKNNNKVFLVDSQKLHSLRTEEDFKSDENDVLLLKNMVLQKKIIGRDITNEYIRYHQLKPLQTIYELLTRTSVRIQNIKKAFDREHEKSLISIKQNLVLDQQVDAIGKQKEIIAKEMKKEFSSDVKKLNVKGISTALLGQILTIAHPNLFHCKSAYLCYSGLKKLDHNKYNRNLKSLFYLCADETIKHRSDYFRNMYDKMKSDRKKDKIFHEKYETLKLNHENKKKTHFITFDSYLEKVVRNRLSTLIAKRIYEVFKD